MSKPFFSGFLDYIPNYDLHTNEFDQELYHKSLQLLTNALFDRGVVQVYKLNTTGHCSSIAQTLEDYVVSLRAIAGKTILGVFTLITQPPGQKYHHAELLVIRDLSLHETGSYSGYLLELWDNLLYSDSELLVEALDAVSVVDKIALSSLVERVRQMSKSTETHKDIKLMTRKQYRIYDYTEPHHSTPKYNPKPELNLPFNARESFLKMVDVLRKVKETHV